MTDLSLQLSAYLDGELDPIEAAKIEARLDSDPQAQAELDALIEAQALAVDQFEAQLEGAIPLDLVRQIKQTPAPVSKTATPASRPIWGALAATLAAFVIGGAGGYMMKGEPVAVQTAGWLSDIADYHAVYASQGRHLVEVGADEADHIETWLGKTIGASFTIPDLTGFGLTFEGGRLLVANGKPVAQLMYRQEDGTVIALCLQRSATPHSGETTFNEKTINGFDFVSWNSDDANYVVIGPSGQPNLGDVAAQAALDI